MTTPRPLLTATALLCACRGVLSPDGGADPTGDTGTDAAFVPALFGVTAASFTVDAEGRIGPSIDPVAAAAPIPVTVQVTLADAAFDGVLPSDHACTVTLTVDTAFDAVSGGAVPTDPPWLWFDLPGTAEVATDCGALDLPEIWADPAAVIGGHPLSLGVGTLAPSTREKLSHDWYAFDDLEPYLLGGRFNLGVPLEDFPDGWVDTPLALAYAVDPGGVVVRIDGERVLLDEASVALPGGGLAAAQVEVAGVTLISEASALLGR